MKFFSEVPIPSSDFKISHQNKIMCIGSCFAVEIAKHLKDNAFQVLSNPFGTQFHPIAIEHTFNRIYARENYTSGELFQYNNLFSSWDHSHQFSHPNPKKALENINEIIDDANAFLSETDIFIFTLGTAWAYYLTEGNFFVSNCHKVPQKHFDKILLSHNQVFTALRDLILKINDVRPYAKIIFTISPVRHLRDGFRENHVSKGILHQVIHQILSEFEEVQYFPSYEIALDELRDYRFYSEDLVHLNDLGIKYIWEKFISIYLNDETINLIKQIKQIKNAVQHKSFNPNGIHHKKFLYENLKKAQHLEKKLYPKALSKEISFLKNPNYAD